MEFLVNGTRIDASYIEPTTNADDSALMDLHHTSIYYDIGDGAVNVVDLPSSLATGGGQIAYSFIVPVVDGQEVDVSLWATATDNNGNESLPSSTIVKRVDRLAPSFPI